MIVERHTCFLKAGCAREGADSLKGIWERLALPTVHRIYRQAIGPLNVVVQEVEFDDFEERQEFWANCQASPEWQEWSKEWRELQAPGGSNEILVLVE